MYALQALNYHGQDESIVFESPKTIEKEAEKLAGRFASDVELGRLNLSEMQLLKLLNV